MTCLYKSSKEYWSEINRFSCSDGSFLFSYQVPASGKTAEIVLCSGKQYSRCCPGYIQTSIPSKLPLKGNLTVNVPENEREKDSLFIGVFGTDSDVEKGEILLKEFSFKNCTSQELTTRSANANVTVWPFAIPAIIVFFFILLITGILFRKLLRNYCNKSFVKIVQQSRCQSSCQTHRKGESLGQKLFSKDAFQMKENSRSSILLKRSNSEDSGSKSITFNDSAYASIENQNIAGSIPAKSDIVLGRITTLYIVFVEENPKHTEIVLQFARFLQQDLGFRVIIELWEKRKAEENYTVWMKNSMNTANKIIVVWSDGAAERLTLFQNRKGLYNVRDLFSPVVLQIQEDLFQLRNAKKYFFVYFSHTNRNSIPPDFVNDHWYELMTEFEELYFALTDIEKHEPSLSINGSNKIKMAHYSDTAENKNGLALHEAIEEATKYDHTQETLSDEDQHPLMTKSLPIKTLPKPKRNRISVQSLTKLNYTDDPYESLCTINYLTSLKEKQTNQNNQQLCHVCSLPDEGP